MKKLLAITSVLALLCATSALADDEATYTITTKVNGMS